MLACLGFPENMWISSSFLFKVTAEVGKLLGEEKVDAILCVAGGWAGGNAKSKCESSFELVIHSDPALCPAGLDCLGSYYMSDQMFFSLAPRISTVALWGRDEQPTHFTGEEELP